MASKKISQLDTITSLTDNDVFVVNQLGSTKKVVLSTVTNSISSTVSQNLSGDYIKKPATASAQQILTYDGTTSTWVASGLPVNGFSASLSENGYTYLPNGLIIQWGRVLGSMDSDSFDAGSSINSYVVSLSEFRLRNGGVASSNYNYYTAIGY
jgi:hypothetical protein